MRYTLRRALSVLALSALALVILLTIGAHSIFSGRALFGQHGGQAPTSATPTQPQSARPAIERAKQPGPVRSAAAPDLAQMFSWKMGNVFSPGALFVPSISVVKSATLQTDVNGNTFVNPGDTLMYSVVVSNSGTDAMNVVFTDQLNPNLTLVGTATASPIVANETYDTIGNTQLQVASSQTIASPGLFVNGNVLSNDIDPQGGTLTVTAITNGPTTAGGTVTLNTDGTFIYTPQAGDFNVADTFTYTVNEPDGKTGAGTVTINIANARVWYVKNDAAAGGLGRSGDPFNTLAAAQTASAANDIIYVFRGNGTTSGQSLGIALKAGQRLLGEGVALIVPVSVNGGPNPTVLRAAATQPLLDNTTVGGSAVSATNVIPAEIAGLNLAGNTNGIDVSLTGALTGMLLIHDNTVRAAGAEGIDINSATTGALTLGVYENLLTSTGNALDIERTMGTLTIVVFHDNMVSGNTGGSGIVVTGTGGVVTFDAVPGGGINPVPGGTTVIGASGNGVGGNGMVLTNVTGELTFANAATGTVGAGDLDIFADGGAALSVTGGAGGFNLSVTPSAGTLVANAGPAAVINAANINLQLNSLTSTNSASTGVSLTTVTGTFSAPSGSSITNATNADFNISGGTANVTYGGTITDDVGTLVSISGATGGTKTFTGAITDGNDGDGSGIALTSNTGATITFSGGLTLSTGGNTAFTATGGGTVTVTGSTNTLATTTGTALNVDSTFIGSSGLTFLSINANGGTNGIILNITGTTAGTHGGLTVTGTGTTAGSGGTIQNTSNRGASFISARDISLKNMNFTNAGTTDLDATNGGLSTGDNLATNAAIHLQTITNATLDRLSISGGAEQGINGNTVSNFTLSNSSISNAGNEADEDNIHFYNMSGTSAITNTTLTHTDGDDNLNLQTQSGTLTLTISGGSATGGGTHEGSGYLFGIRGTTNATITLSGVNSSDNFSGGIVADAFDTATMNLTVMNSTSSSNNDQLSVSAGDSSNVNLGVTGNTLSSPNAADFVVVSLLGSAFDTGYVFDASISGNTITVGNGRTADGIVVNNAGGGTMNVAITTNTFDYAGTQRAILIQGGQDGVATSNVTVTGNNIDIKLDGTGNAVTGILAQVAVATPAPPSPGSAGSFLCFDAGGGTAALRNTFTHSLGGNMPAGDIRVRQRFASTVRLPGYGGANNNDAAVVTYLAGRNTLVNSPTATATNEVGITAGAGGFIGGAACTQPNLMALLIESDKQLKLLQQERSGGHGDSGSASLVAGPRRMLSPVFSAFTSARSQVDWSRAFNTTGNAIAPIVAAAESKLSESNTAPAASPASNPVPATPARTMIVNGRGEYRIVPTAALAGELITINGAGGGFLLPAGKSTTIMFNAQIALGFTGTVITNQATVTAAGGISVNSNNLSTPVIQAPNFTKAFNPATIVTNTGVSTLTFTLVNPNSSQALSAVAFTDSLLNNLQVAATPGATTSGCGAPTWSPAAAATTLSFSGGTIAGGATCTVSVNVRATTEGSKPNTSSTATSTQANASGTATATLTVINAPTFSKAFGAPSVALNGTTSLTFTITNNSATSSLSGIGFTDTLPAGLIVATPNGLSTTCSGTAAATAGGGSISLTGASLATSASCTLTVNVTGTTAGAKPNSATLATTELGANSASTGTVTLTVVAPPTVAKSFVATVNIAAGPTGATEAGNTVTITTTTAHGFATGQPVTIGGVGVSGYNGTFTITSTPAATTFTYTNPTAGLAASGGGTATSGITSIPVGTNATMGFLLTNPNTTTSLTGVGFQDSLPVGITVVSATTPQCGGTVATTSSSVTFSSGTLGTGGSSTCTVSVTVMGAQVGSWPNTATNVTSTEGGPGANSNTATLVVLARPTVTKMFSPATIAPGGTSTLTITLGNTNSVPLTGAAVTDTLPTNVTTTAAAATTTCGGTAGKTANSVSLTGGTIPANGTCTLTVGVTSSIAGVYTNTIAIGALTTNNGGSNTVAGSAMLTVASPPTVTKSFSPTSIPVNGTSTLTINFTNPNSSVALTGLAISDSLPAGVEVNATPGATNTCGGTFIPAASATSISLSGGSLGTGGSNTCAISVVVKATTAGAKPNTTGNVSTTESGAGGTASATLNVFAPPSVTKTFSPTSIAAGGISTLTITITNPAGNPSGVTGVSISDSFPAGLEVDATPMATNTCGGTFAPAAAGTSISLTGGAIATAGGSCAISVVVKATTSGAKMNTTGNVSSTEGGAGGTASATLNVTTPATPATTGVIINELRTSGPAGAGDDFVELYNNTNSNIQVQASDASAGWAVVKAGATCASAPILVVIIPNGTVVPARGSYLLVGSAYSLNAYAVANQTLTLDIENDANVGLFNSATTFTAGTRLDAVGFGSNTGANCDTLREGSNLAAAGGSTSQYSFVRKIGAGGLPQDTSNNSADFAIVSNTPTVAVGSNATPVLGAPGPENALSLLQRTSLFAVGLIEPNALSTDPPNRVRDINQTALITAPNAGTMEIRRRYTNNTGGTVTQLRFRITGITTLNSPVIYAGQADIRSLTTSDFAVTTSLGMLTVKGTLLESPSDQGTTGGGVNSSLTVALPGGGLANTQTLDLNFLLGIKTNGRFAFNITIEALP